MGLKAVGLGLEPDTAPAPRTTPTLDRRCGVREAAALLVLVVIAAALRWPGLNPSSLWLDDAWVAMVTHTDTLDEIRHVGLTAPAFAASLKAIFVVFGFGELAAQALPFLAGIAGPPVAYLVARRLAWGHAARWTAGLLLALSPVAITYGVRVKPYTIDLFFALLIIWAGTELLTAQKRRRWLTITLLLGVVALPFSPFSALQTTAVLGTDIIVRVVEGERGRRLHRSVAVLGTWGSVGAAWYLVALRPLINDDMRAFWDRGYIVLSDGPLTALRTVSERTARVVGDLVGFATRDPMSTAVAIVLLVAAMVVVARRQWWLALILGLPLAAAVGLAMLGAMPLGTGRGDMYLYPSLALLLAGGMDVLWSSLRDVPARRLLRGVAVALVAAVMVAGLNPATYPHQDTRPLIDLLAERRAPTDHVLVYPLTRFAFALYGPSASIVTDEHFGSTPFDVAISDDRVLVLPLGRDDPSVYAPSVQEVAASGSRVWLLASHWRDDLTNLKEQLQRAGLRQTDRVRRAGAELTLWEPPRVPTAAREES